jgi:hypothetical protein
VVLDSCSPAELIIQLRKIEKLPGEKKKIVKELLGSFIFQSGTVKTVGILNKSM